MGILTLLGVLVGTALALLAVWLLWPLRYPLPTESDYSHHKTPWWHLYYCNKYLRSIKRAKRGSGLEEKFRNMTFRFADAPLTDAQEIVVKAAGDLMCRKDLVGDGGRHLWDEVGEYLFDADLSIGNMEFAVNPEVYILKLIRFSVPPEYALPVLGDERFGRFDLVSLANNHINDSYSQGIVSTCNWLDSIGLRHVGANRTAQEQDEFPIFDIKGARIAVLSYTFSTNAIPLDSGFEFGTNLVRFNALRDEDYDPSLIHRHIRLARQRGADYIISCHHWGLEFEYYPPPRLVRRAEELFEAGIDLILGHHPHGLNPVGHHQASDGRDCLAFYSLGNMTAAGLPFRIHKLGELAEIVLETGTGKDGTRVVRPKNVVLTPTYHSRLRRGGEVQQRILHVQRGLERAASGDPPGHLGRRQVQTLKYVDREFRRHFLPGGVELR